MQDQTSDNRQRCAGMYSKASWGGSVDPHILVKFKQQPDAEGDPIASLVMFEWKDFDLVGVYPTAESMTVCLLNPCTEISAK